MRKIANAKELAAELRTLLAKTETPYPSRREMASSLRKLAFEVEGAYGDSVKADLTESLQKLESLTMGPAVWIAAHNENEGLAAANKQKLEQVVKSLQEIVASMPQTVTYMVVGMADKPLTFKSVDELEKMMAHLGHKVVKYTDRPSLRPELRGQPVFSGLLGPMHGGAGVVRYETQKVYNDLSR